MESGNFTQCTETGPSAEVRQNLEGINIKSVTGLAFKGGEFKFEHKLNPEETKLFRRLDSNFLKYELLTAYAGEEEKKLLIKKGYEVLRLLREIIGGC